MSDPPRITVVTPSYNQGEFLEAAMKSVLDQGYPELEYIVLDGGSTDRSAEIIGKYSDRLAFWRSERDAGQYPAIQAGFERSTGEVMAWLNADDMYLPWTFRVVGEIFATHPGIEWITSNFPITWDRRGIAVECHRVKGYSKEGFWRGEHLAGAGWRAGFGIQQESTFWRRSLWERTGARLDHQVTLAADFELWTRFFAVAELWGVETPLGGFRRHEEQKTGRGIAEYLEQARRVFVHAGGRPPSAGRCRWLARMERWAPRRYHEAMGLIRAAPICEFDPTTGRWEAVRRC